MESSGRKYTFEDWRSGRVDDEWGEWASELGDQHTDKFGELPEKIFNEGEYQRIQEEREKAFFKAVELNVSYHIQEFEKALEGIEIDERIRLTEEELEYCDLQYEKSDPDIRQDVRFKRYKLYGLSHVRYEIIHSITADAMDNPIKLDFTEAGDDVANLEDVDPFTRVYSNKWFDIYINRGYRKEVNVLFNQLQDLTYESTDGSGKKSLSTLEKIELVEKNRKRSGVVNYEEAIRLAAKESGEYIFKDYRSFNSSRNRFKDLI